MISNHIELIGRMDRDDNDLGNGINDAANLGYMRYNSCFNPDEE